MCLFCCLATVRFISSGFYGGWQMASRCLIKMKRTFIKATPHLCCNFEQQHCSGTPCCPSSSSSRSSIMFCKVLKDNSFCLSETFAGYLEAQCSADRFRFTAQLIAEEHVQKYTGALRQFGISFWSICKCVCACACLSPRLDFGRKKIWPNLLLKEDLGCLGLNFAGPELKPRWGTALLSSLPTEQTESAEIVSLSTKKQSSSL